MSISVLDYPLHKLKQELKEVFKHTTPLLANETIESDPIKADRWSRITGSVKADQNGTLIIEQSPDGVNWDVQDTFTITANNGIGFSVEVVCPYVRVRYINGSTDQTEFRLYVFLRRY